MAVRKLDLTKPVQLKDGTKARVLATDLRGGSTIVIAYDSGTEDCEYLGTRYPNGRVYRDVDSTDDLINVPEPPKEVWVNIYPGTNASAYVCGGYSTREKADAMANKARRVACIKVTYTEGEGLED